MPRRSYRIGSDRRNRLTIEAEKPSAEYGDGPATGLKKVSIEGKWGMTEEHDLSFRVTGSDSAFRGQTFIFNGSMNSVSGNGLSFNVRRCKTLAGTVTGSINLKGAWRADTNNRIVFNVTKGRGRYDVIRLQGLWNIGKDNALEYRYTRTSLKTRQKKEHTLRFKGTWHLGNGKIKYGLEGTAGVSLCFDATLSRAVAGRSGGLISYDLVIGYLRKNTLRERIREIAFGGTWKTSKSVETGLSVVFRGRRIKETVFYVKKALNNRTDLTLHLKSSSSSRIGVKLKIEREVLPDFRIFLELARSGEGNSIMAGGAVKF